MRLLVRKLLECLLETKTLTLKPALSNFDSSSLSNPSLGHMLRREFMNRVSSDHQSSPRGLGWDAWGFFHMQFWISQQMAGIRLIHSRKRGKLAGRRQLGGRTRVESGQRWKRKHQQEKSNVTEAVTGTKGQSLGVSI